MRRRIGAPFLNHVGHVLPGLRARLVDAADLIVDGAQQHKELLFAGSLAVVGLGRLLEALDQVLQDADLWQQQQRFEGRLEVLGNLVEQLLAPGIAVEAAVEFAIFLGQGIALGLLQLLEKDAKVVVALRELIERPAGRGGLFAH